MRGYLNHCLRHLLAKQQRLSYQFVTPCDPSDEQASIHLKLGYQQQEPSERLVLVVLVGVLVVLGVVLNTMGILLHT